MKNSEFFDQILFMGRMGTYHVVSFPQANTLLAWRVAFHSRHIFFLDPHPSSIPFFLNHFNSLNCLIRPFFFCQTGKNSFRKRGDHFTCLYIVWMLRIKILFFLKSDKHLTDIPFRNPMLPLFVPIKCQRILWNDTFFCFDCCNLLIEVY